MLDNAFSIRADFRVVGFCSDAMIAAAMIRKLKPDIVTIDLVMPYIDGAELLNMIGDLANVCKIIVSDVPLKNLLLASKLVDAGAAACLGKSELLRDPEQFFQKINQAADTLNMHKNKFHNSITVPHDQMPRSVQAAVVSDKIPYPIPADELSRLQAIHRKDLCNSTREPQFDLITSHVAAVTAFPVCLLTFIDKDVQWIKSSSGIDLDKTSRQVAFCNYTIAQGGAFVVANTMTDERFAKNPLVTGAPSIRCYAGHAITIEGGVQIGALCVIDNKVRSVSKPMLDQLAGMSRIIGELINQRPAIAA